MRRSPRWLHFGPFRLDLQRCALWCDDERLSLRPQTATVLQYLAERPDQVISTEELLAQNWLDTHVSNTVLRVCIREIRHVLEDKANDPQYVQTVRGQGYRFCGHVETIIPSTTNDPTMATPSELIGREQLLSQCYNAFQRALSGQRQVLFFSGEAGMGKTTVINAFLTGLEGTSRLCIAQGQCVELTGQVEAYMPMLAALSQLGLGADRERLISALYQAAPTWLTHLPMLVPNADREVLQRQVQGSTRARMIRELVDAFDVFTAERPLVLVLEDLHWSDPSTIDLLAVLAHRRTPAHLLVLGSFRPLELQVQGHPLGRLLQMLEENDHRHELTLPPLNHAAVQAYVKTRLQAPAAFDVTNLLYERSAGNTLLLARLLDRTPCLSRIGLSRLRDNGNFEMSPLHGKPSPREFARFSRGN
ncbi:hypothetical protein C2W62_33230 [Candidatus Entotheonella serta]|nr:hypothetical protein C2W62_33230 [Candidatus Entotheonella serta]